METLLNKREKILIPSLIEGPAPDFAAHLEHEGNDRIIFSGRFGTGKTTFLNNFFENQEQHCQSDRKYNVIHLSPVNYSVATNEDIFRYIKFDIICKLILEHKAIVEKDSFKSKLFDRFIGFTIENLPKVLSPLLMLVSKVSPQLVDSDGKDIFIVLSELAKSFHDYLEKNKKELKGDHTQVLNLIKTVTEQEGSVYEENFYTNLIRQYLEELRSESKLDRTIENVLIIDDLDRIDPHHIFRIFNVFAAHLDCYTWKDLPNKFGFDKIIFVCDINNIKGIYEHIYGKGVDFRGYINKFYSRKIFNYNNENQLLELLGHIVQGIEVKSNDERASDLFNSNELLQKEVADLLLPFIQTKLITIRDLAKFKSISLPIRKVRFNDTIEVLNSDLMGLVVVEYFIQFFGSLENFEDALNELNAIPNKAIYSYYGQIRDHMLLILSYSQHSFRKASDSNITTRSGYYTFKLLYDHGYKCFYAENVEYRSIGKDDWMFSVLKEGIDLMKARRII